MDEFGVLVQLSLIPPDHNDRSTRRPQVLAPGSRPARLRATGMNKAARFLLEKSHAVLDGAGMNFLPDKKRHNIWAERPPKRPKPPADPTDRPRRSPLSELPEELLLHIMQNLDPPSLLCLRRTSWKFMRLFGDSSFREFHGHAADGGWQPENVKAIQTNKALRIFRELIGRDRLCEDCLSVREGPDSKMSEYLGWSERPLHCSQCKVDHPSCAFSKKQRSLPASRRTCIAREGRVRLCRHKSFTWAELERHVLDEVAPARRGRTVFACGNRHERREVRFAFYGRSYRLALATGDRWMEHISRVEYDWDDDSKVPPAEKDWCPDRDYTWLCAETDDGVRRPLVPESSWYRLVDPASFDLTDDDESFGVTWCWTKSCPNYWRCHELRRGWRVYLPCEEGCGGSSCV
ncbi:hypothetical protein VUR80DRAFT_1255 [Thermomyces stellatus]